MEFQPMSPDERERMMQFLLDQQAQFAADHARSQERLDRVEDALLTVTGVIGRQAERHDALTEGQAKTDEQLRRTDEQLERTGERLAALGERVDTVVNLFERHLRVDHGIQ